MTTFDNVQSNIGLHCNKNVTPQQVSSAGGLGDEDCRPGTIYLMGNISPFLSSPMMR